MVVSSQSSGTRLWFFLMQAWVWMLVQGQLVQAMTAA